MRWSPAGEDSFPGRERKTFPGGVGDPAFLRTVTLKRNSDLIILLRERPKGGSVVLTAKSQPPVPSVL